MYSRRNSKKFVSYILRRTLTTFIVQYTVNLIICFDPKNLLYAPILPSVQYMYTVQHITHFLAMNLLTNEQKLSESIWYIVCIIKIIISECY